MGDVTGGLVLPRPARRIAGPEEPHPPEAARGTSHQRPRWQFWRSPPDQPPWARPALLAVAALASFSYFWGIGNATLETFYGGAVRSMSESWRNFFFGAFDPWGTVTLDKLPGAFWVQALSVRAFGFHVWSVVLPQAVEGTLTVLVLFRAVRRVAGAAAGLVAAIVLAVTPVVILLDRGNVSDTLLILLLVLAADAVTAATLTGRVTHLLVASLWVGLAFQAKMLEAWVVLPALWGAYVLAAPNPVLARRVGHAARVRRSCRGGLLVVHDGGHDGPDRRPSVRGRELQRLSVHPGVRLQRRRADERRRVGGHKVQPHPGRGRLPGRRRHRNDPVA